MNAPDLQDAAPGLATWLGQVLPGVDEALQEVSASSWTPDTKLAVQRVMSSEIVHEFIDGGPIFEATSVAQLDREARLHLARFLLARARAKYLDNRAAQEALEAAKQQ